MAGVSFVSADYYRGHLCDLRLRLENLKAEAHPGRRRELAGLVRFSARCLMRSDCPDVTEAERAEAERLIDGSAGYLARHGLAESDERRQRTIEAYKALEG